MKKLIFVDWLQFSCDLVINTKQKEFEVIKLDYGTKQYKEIYEIKYKNKEFCFVCFSPRVEFIKKNANVKINNEYLYNNELKNILLKFHELFEVININVSRLDLAIDVQYLDVEINNKINKLNTNEFIKNIVNENIYILGYQNFNINKTKMFYTSFSAGTRRSTCFLRVYNKTVELEKSKKEYIQEIHKREFNEEVTRIELQVNFLERFNFNENRKLSELSIFEILDNIKHIAQVVFTKKFVICENNKNDSNKNRYKSKSFILDELCIKLNNYIHKKITKTKTFKILKNLIIQTIDLFTNINYIDKNTLFELKKLFYVYKQEQQYKYLEKYIENKLQII